MTLDFLSVTFRYPSQTDSAFSNLTVKFGEGWTGIVGPNGSGKTTLLLLAARQLSASSGRVRSAGAVVYCPQRTDNSPSELPELLNTPDGLAAQLVGQLGIAPDWPHRWHTLSHGERKRAQIACALWQHPGILAIDEPTNHVDAATGEFLANALARFKGIGLLVSHDRALLDRLCSACLVLEHGTAILRRGNYTQANATASQEMESRRNEKDIARRDLAALSASASNRRRQADQADAKRSKRHLRRGDADGRAMINLARVSGKDGQAGRLLAQLDARLDRARERVGSLFVPKERRLGVELRGEIARRRILLGIDDHTIPVGDGRTLSLPRLEISNQDRIGITGPNGSGKSTLLRHLIPQFEFDADRLVYLPQEIDAPASTAIIKQVKQLDTHRLGEVMTAIACLGSDPHRLLATQTPSPGESRKLLLALGLCRRPYIVIMDEPTNHLDLHSIACIEEALAQCQCAIILVSHDTALLQRLTPIHWNIAASTNITQTLAITR